MDHSSVEPQSAQRDRVAFVLCGALAREVRAIVQRHGWDVALFGVSALDHLRPERIAPDVERRLHELIPQFARIIVVYGDCGSGGQLDAVLDRFNVPRISGPHCYEMYGGDRFEALIAEEPGTFFLTDFLVQSFRRTVVKGLGIDRFPELQAIYFGNYTRLVYFVQRAHDQRVAQAQAIAAWLGLPLDVRYTGYNLLETRLAALMAEIWNDRYRPILPLNQEQHGNDDVSSAVLARHSRAGARPRRGRTTKRAATGTLSGSDRSSGDGGRLDRLG